MMRQALQIREQLLAENDPAIAQSLSSLGHIYAKQFKYSKTEPLFHRAIIIYQQCFNDDVVHSDTIGPVNGLDIIYYEQKKYAESELMYQKFSATSTTVCRNNHPQMAFALKNLARLYYDCSRYDDAKQLFQKLFFIGEP